MPASYPNAVKTYTTKSDGAGNRIQADHINALQDEVTAIEDGLLNGTAPIASSNITAPALQVTTATITNLVSGGGRLVLPSSGGSTGQVLTIVSTSGSTQTLEWRSAAGVSSAAGSTVGSLTVSSNAPATPVANTLYANTMIKAWAYHAASTALYGAFNIAAVTASGSTSLRFTFATPMASSVYAVIGNADGGATRVGDRASTGFLMNYDPLSAASVIVIG